MQLLHHPTELKTQGRAVSVAIGVFDGVHVGHRHVLREATVEARRRQGLAVGVTFDRHPQTVIAPASAPLALHPLPHKLHLLEQAGLDATWVIPFDRTFSQQPAEAFIQLMADGFQPLRSIAVGESFVFGRHRGGNVDLLRSWGKRLDFEVRGLPAVQVDGEVASSTRIRELIAAGQLDQASRLLGRPYTVSGRVIAGKQLGRQLGFPTANLDTEGLVLPPDGVHAAWVRMDQLRVAAVLNIGRRPTVDAATARRHFEVHLLDFQGDLYGRELEVEFVSRLRGETRFPSREALQAQIARDAAAARQILCP